MPTHSPEPWYFCGNHIDDANGLSAIRDGRNFEALQPENLHRAVRCVNACAGLADPSAVPDLLAALRGLVDEIDRPGGTVQNIRWDRVPDIRAALAKAEGKA